MTVQWITPPNNYSSTASPPTATYKYVLHGVTDETLANSYALSFSAPLATTIYGILYRNNIQLDRTAYNQWAITVPYAQRQNATGAWTWDFDTTGGTIHITNAKAEVGRYPTATAPNQLGSIAVDGDEVKGTEIIVPALKMNVTYKHPLGVITIPQAKFLASITGTVNSDTFLTFSPGEVLFLGARGQDGTDSEASVNYQFAMASNATGLTIGSIAGVAKKAWEVAWIRYHDTITTEGAAENPTRVPKYVYVDRVYDTIAMAAALGFGG